MVIVQDRDRDSNQDKVRESGGIPATGSTNLPVALPPDIKDYLSKPQKVNEYVFASKG